MVRARLRLRGSRLRIVLPILFLPILRGLLKLRVVHPVALLMVLRRVIRTLLRLLGVIHPPITIRRGRVRLLRFGVRVGVLLLLLLLLLRLRRVIRVVRLMPLGRVRVLPGFLHLRLRIFLLLRLSQPRFSRKIKSSSLFVFCNRILATTSVTTTVLAASFTSTPRKFVVNTILSRRSAKFTLLLFFAFIVAILTR